LSKYPAKVTGKSGAVALSMVEKTCTTHPRGWQEWTLKFQTLGTAAADAALRKVCVQGLRSDQLTGLLIFSEAATVFGLDSLVDPIGRTITCGELIAAMFGRGDDGRQCVPAADFEQRVTAQHLRVHLRVRASESLHIERIGVCCSLL
jgi:hypothetical protein